MKVSLWPVGSEKAQRLMKFHASQYYPRGESMRSHDISDLWARGVAGMHAFELGKSIGLISLSPLRGPTQLAERRVRRSIGWKGLGRGLVRTLAGTVGRLIPEVWWRKVCHYVMRWVEISSEEREYQLAKRAFAVASRARRSQIVRIETLHRVPALREQLEASPALSLYIADILNTLAPYFDQYGVKRVLEIGPGSGLLAASLHSLFGCRFVLVDLPEVLNLSFAILSTYVRDAEIVLPHEVSEIGEEAWQKDFVLLCPEQVGLIPPSSLDCAINASSFQEMTYPLIESYFRLIRNCLKEGGLFYCLNETKFSRHSNGSTIEFDKYPWFGDFQDLFHEEHEYWRLMKSYPRRHRLQVKGA